MGEQVMDNYLAWVESEMLSPGEVERKALDAGIPLNRTTLLRVQSGRVKKVQRRTVRMIRDLMDKENNKKN